MNRRVAITGLGIVAPTGVGQEAFWASSRAGRSGVVRPALLDEMDVPVKVLGEVRDFVATDHLSKKLIVRSDRNTHFAFAACTEALADANITLAQEDRSRIGIVLAANYGGTRYYLDNLVRLHQKGPSFVSAYMAIAWIPSAPVGQLSIFHGITGYTKTILNDSAGGIDAVGIGYRALLRGEADVIISGGFDAMIAEAAIATMATFQDVCHDAPDPATAYRPFSRHSLGTVLAEGGSILILEDLARAQARGARIYGEIIGYAQTTDAVDFHCFAPDGRQYARAMREALCQAGLTPADVAYFSADGRAATAADRSEARALQQLFCGQRRAVPVSAPKAMTGNTMAGAGPLDIASAMLAMRDGIIPPTINVCEQDPECDLDLITDHPREATIDVAMIGERGTGGVNSVLVVHRPD